MLAASKPAVDEQRSVVISTGGLSAVLNLCFLLGCQVQGNLDGTVGQTFLVSSANPLSTVLNLVESLLGIVSIEAGNLLPVPHTPLPRIPPGLYNTTPSTYYDSCACH